MSSDTITRIETRYDDAFEQELVRQPSARGLVLSQLSTLGVQRMSVAQLVSAGTLFGIEEGAVRVALGRMVRDGLLVSPERGQYEIGPKGRGLSDKARSWVNAEDRTREWTGGWVVVFTANLGRRNKTLVRARERALGLYGFVSAVPGLWVRPDNLTMSLAEIRTALITVGLDEAALTMVVSELEAPEEFRLNDLWSAQGVEAKCRAALTAMADSRRLVREMDDQQAARETLMVGEAVIRIINRDPQLPDEIVDNSLRRQVIAEMREYQVLGTECMDVVFNLAGAPMIRHHYNNK